MNTRHVSVLMYLLVLKKLQILKVLVPRLGLFSQMKEHGEKPMSQYISTMAVQEVGENAFERLHLMASASFQL